MRRPFAPLIVLGAALLAWAPAGACSAAELKSDISAPAVGVGGFVRPGAWTPLGPFPAGPAAVSVTDGDGLRLKRSVKFNEAGQAVFQAGRAESGVTVRLGEAGGVEGAAWTARPGEDFTVLGPDERLWVALRVPAALQSTGDAGAAGVLDRTGRPVRLATFDHGDDLPAVPGGLSIVRLLIAEAGDLPSDDRVLREWVAGGGHLIVSLAATGELPDWISLTPGDPTPLTARTALERLAKSGSGRGAAVINRLVPAAARPFEADEVRAANGRVLATGDGGALVAELPIGFGRVTVVAASLHAAPLSGWGGLPAFLLELVRAAPGGANPGDKPPAGELAGQVYSALEADAVGGVSPGTVGLWVLALLVVVGPLDYLLVHRLLNRPALTWVTLPIWLGGAIALALWGAGEADPRSRRLEIVDVDAAAGRVRGAAWASVPAPEAGRLSVRFAPSAVVGGEPGGGEQEAARLGYAAEPGATFGGLYRGGGIGLAPAEYEIVGLQARAVPLPELSAKRFRLDWTAERAGLVSGSLVAADGTLRGTVSHTLPGTLSDFFLVHNGTVYRPDPDRGVGPSAGTLPTGERWRPDGPGVVRRDLRGFLTQVREVREGPSPLSGAADGADLLGSPDYGEERRLVRTRYAARSRDFGVILPAVSLYAQSGGASFTGLSNAELETLDLSAFAGAGRALLFGRLDVPLTELDVTFADAAPADGQVTTYVRAILPVGTGAAAESTPQGPRRGPIGFSPDSAPPSIPRRRPLDNDSALFD